MSRGEHLFGHAPAHRLISQTGHRRVLHPGWQTAACATDIPDVGTNLGQDGKNGNPCLCHKGDEGKVAQPAASILGEHGQGVPMYPIFQLAPPQHSRAHARGGDSVFPPEKVWKGHQ